MGFRFETVKDIFYSEFLDGAKVDEFSDLMPKIWHLSQNFRTHSGVVNLANSVVELMMHFFPHFIDRLPPESSRIAGFPPVFLESKDDLVVELFQHTGGMHSCEFGAEQAILVCDEETKKRIKDISGSKALVLTVLEAKGMEFTDCLVYNFFASSAFGNDWRTIYSAVEALGCQKSHKPHPRFDEHKHSALCLELKLLYVLLTRARQQLIIFDSNLAAREPMLDFWLERNLVELRPLDDETRSTFAKSSTPEEWKAKGLQFFQRQQFENARLCFERAKDECSEQLCLASSHEQSAERLLATNPKKAKELFVQAADEFRHPLLGDRHLMTVARCFQRADEFEKAAKYFLQANYYADAADCFESANMWSEAAQAYVANDDIDSALDCCYEVAHFELARSILDSFRARHKELVTPGAATTVTSAAAVSTTVTSVTGDSKAADPSAEKAEAADNHQEYLATKTQELAKKGALAFHQR